VAAGALLVVVDENVEQGHRTLEPIFANQFRTYFRTKYKTPNIDL
jgi:hypothetical protein